MTDRSEFIGVRLTPEEHRKFTEYIEDSNEFDSMSRFLRTVAHRYIATDDEELSLDPEEIIEAVDTAVMPLSERLDQIEDHVVSIDSNVRDDDKIDKLARDIYSSLPVHDDETGLPNLDEVGQYANASDIALVQAISTPEMWGEYYDEDLQDVRRACARMQEYYPDVKFARDELGGSDTQIPTHDDISISHATSHTDSFVENSEATDDERTPTADLSHNTVRRYYKTQGD